MKKVLSSIMLLAAAAMAFSSCNKEELKNNDGQIEGNVVMFHITASTPETKSVFGSKEDNAYPTLWTANKNVAFSRDEAAFVEGTPVLVDGGKTATFEVELPGEGTEGTIYAFSPKGVYDRENPSNNVPGFTGISADHDDVYLLIPSEQTPLANSVDEAAQAIVGSKSYTIDGEGKINLDMSFSHVVAYGKMTITNFAGGKIKSVQIVFPGDVVSGTTSSWYYYAGDKKGTIERLGGKTITLNAENVVDNVFWFGLAPTEGTTGEMKIVVTDDNNDTYTKTIDLTKKALPFVKGHVSSFTANFKDIKPDSHETVVYQKVTSISDIVPGIYIILANVNDTYYTMKNAEVAAKGLIANAFNTTGLLMSADTITGNASDYSWKFEGTNVKMAITSTSVPTCYLYATGNNNGMVVGTTTKDDTWAFNNVDGGFYMKDSKQRRYLSLYNEQDWRCYLNTENGQPVITLYKKLDNRTVLPSPEAIAVDNVIEWDEVANADSYTILIGDKELSGITTNSYTFSNDDFNLETGYYDASIKAVTNNPSMFIDSGFSSIEGKIKVGTPTLPTPVLSADVINASDITIKWTVDALAIAGYSCSINIPDSEPKIINSGSVSFDGLTAETEYTITVYAIATEGECSYAQSETATITVKTKNEASEFPITASWSRSDGSTNGFSFVKTLGADKSGYIQDNSGSEGFELNLIKADKSPIFVSTPSSIIFSATIGGGSPRDVLVNNVYVHLTDKDGNIINESTTVVTTKVENTNGKEYTVSIPVVGNVYGIKLTHNKETSYNVRVYGFSISVH